MVEYETSVLNLNLTPKGLGLPYVGFSDFGQAAVNAINFWIFLNFLRL
jgi:hypothetical protein